MLMGCEPLNAARCSVLSDMANQQPTWPAHFQFAISLILHPPRTAGLAGRTAAEDGSSQSPQRAVLHIGRHHFES